MANMVRTFIGVPCPPTNPLRKVLRTLRDMDGSLRVVTAEKMHLTLRFLGDTPTVQLNDIARTVEHRLAGRAAFDLHLRGLGVFPHRRRPTVCWAGIEEDGGLSAAADELAEALEPLGFARENRRFQPHLTLARIRSRPPEDLFALLDEHAATDFGAVRLDRIHLYESELTPEGSEYTVLATVDLQG